MYEISVNYNYTRRENCYGCHMRMFRGCHDHSMETLCYFKLNRYGIESWCCYTSICTAHSHSHNSYDTWCSVSSASHIYSYLSRRNIVCLCCSLQIKYYDGKIHKRFGYTVSLRISLKHMYTGSKESQCILIFCCGSHITQVISLVFPPCRKLRCRKCSFIKIFDT